MTDQETIEYLKNLQVGEEVVETANTCMKGRHGIVYRSERDNSLCVLWNTPEGKMGTSVTWGTRRVKEISTNKRYCYRNGEMATIVSVSRQHKTHPIVSKDNNGTEFYHLPDGNIYKNEENRYDLVEITD